MFFNHFSKIAKTLFLSALFIAAPGVAYETLDESNAESSVESAPSIAKPGATPDAPQTIWYPYDSGLGADGYDVVAFFMEHEPIKGTAEFTARYGGLEWRFANEKHRATFVAAPQKYIPEYGGHCAYGVSFGALPFGDPEAWTVHKDKLYFNFNKSVRDRWFREKSNYIRTANNEWQERLSEKFTSGKQ